LTLPAEAPVELGQDSRVNGLPAGSFTVGAPDKKG
jgi:hypothetical protein